MNATATLATESGLKLTLTDSQTSQTLNDLIGNLQSTGAPIFDFSSLPSSLDGPLDVSVELAKEANYNYIVGFYRVLDETGSVTDSLTGNILLPSDSEYSSIALDQTNLVSAIIWYESRW